MSPKFVCAPAWFWSLPVLLRRRWVSPSRLAGGSVAQYVSQAVKGWKRLHYVPGVERFYPVWRVFAHRCGFTLSVTAPFLGLSMCF